MTNPTPRDSAQFPPTTFDEWLKRESPAGCVSDMEMGWNAATEALRAQAASVEPWLSMASAPKDGTAILAPLEGSDMPYPIRWIDDGWEMVWDGDRLSDHDEPRYWMPIPDLPGEAGAPPAHIPADVDPGHLSDLRYVLNVLKKMGAQGEVEHGDVLAAIVGMNYIIARTEAAPQPQAVAASSPVTAVDAVELMALADRYRNAEGGKDATDSRENLRAALQASRQPQAQQCGGESCEWRGDDDGLWFSSCGGTPWSFEDGGPTENKKMFCIHCGKRLALATKARS